MAGGHRLPRTAVRMLLVTVLGQLLGVLAAGAALQVSGLTAEWLSWLILVVAGLVPGVALGLLLTPGPGQWRTCVTTAAVAAAVVASVLILMARRAGPVGELGWGPALAGAITITATQTLTVWLLWARRGRA